MLADRFVPNLDATFRVLRDPNFVAVYGHLLRFQATARGSRHDAEALILLQAEMANEVIHLQESQRKYARRMEAGQDAALDLRGAIDVCKGMVYCIRKVADGIAWRSLGYDRGMIHALSDAHLTGHIERESAMSEVTEAAQLVAETGDIALLNDLTYIIRFGDITSVSSKYVSIAEVKAGKGSAKSGKALKQKTRLRELVKYVNSREKTSDSGTQRLASISAKPLSHAPELVDVLRRARKGGQADARLSQALAVEAFWTEAFNLENFPRIHNPFSQSPEAGYGHSLRFFGMPAPLVAPYPIFPWPDEDCIDVLTGRLLVLTFFNVRNVVRALKRRGFNVRLPTQADLAAAPQNLKPGQIAEHELDLPIVVGNDSHTILMSAAQLGRLSVEFLDEESLADMVEEQFAGASKEGEELSFPAFAQEHLLWD